MTRRTAEVIIVGGGLAGLSAAIYLGRAKRDVLVIDEVKSMARWEPAVENYLGYPHGVAGQELLEKGRAHARRYGARFVHDRITSARTQTRRFTLSGKKTFYSCRRLLLATGAFHIPPDIPGAKPCLGHSLFFCKDCDGHRVQGKNLAIYGWTNEAVEYALGLLAYSSCVAIVTDGRTMGWDRQHDVWVKQYAIPVHRRPILMLRRLGRQLLALEFNDLKLIEVDALFTTRGDLYFNQLAKELGAKVNTDGEVVVDPCMRTNVPRLYSAGCVTPANCQMIIAAGQGAAAAQAINRDLFEESLAANALRRFRHRQLRSGKTKPKVISIKHGLSATGAWR